MKTIEDINQILDDVSLFPTFKKFIKYDEEIKKYIDEHELSTNEKRKQFIKTNFVFYSKISLFYYEWSRFVLSWLLRKDNPCLIRFVSYHRYISKLGHRRTMTEYFNLPNRMYIDSVICAFRALSERYDLGLNGNRVWEFHYKNFINLSSEFGVPTTITLYDMYDQWHFENAFQSCVQNKLDKLLT